MIVRNLTITSAATAVLIAKTGFGDPIIIENLGTGVLYIGTDDTVTDADGFRITASPAANSVVNLLNNSGDVYGYAKTANCDVRIIENVSG